MTAKSTAKQDVNNWSHYTPWDLAWHLAVNAIDPLLSVGTSVDDIFVLDPACGDGELLLAAATHLEQLGMSRADTVNHVVGCDIDEVAVVSARERLYEWCAKEPLGLTVGSAFDQNWSNEFGRGRGPNCVVMNPPFKGGNKIDTELRATLNARWRGPKTADLSAYFLRLAGDVLCQNRGPVSLGCLATNTIAQGDTRELGLLPMMTDDGWDLWVTSGSFEWPGLAAVACKLFVLVHSMPLPEERRLPMWASTRLRTHTVGLFNEDEGAS